MKSCFLIVSMYCADGHHQHDDSLRRNYVPETYLPVLRHSSADRSQETKDGGNEDSTSASEIIVALSTLISKIQGSWD